MARVGVEVELKECKNAGNKVKIFLNPRQLALPTHAPDAGELSR
jgi:hypothetical protein